MVMNENLYILIEMKTRIYNSHRNCTTLLERREIEIILVNFKIL